MAFTQQFFFFSFFTITLVSRELKKQCFVLPIASLSVCTQIKPKKQVDRSSREEVTQVTHSHLAPVKKEKKKEEAKEDSQASSAPISKIWRSEFRKMPQNFGEFPGFL